jgi:sensor histidine kinase regulating citrate/malate metabolism
VREHYRAMVSVPLQLGADRRVIGVLNAYRGTSGPWAPAHVELLLSLADHAAIAVQTARLLDETRRQVSGLSLVVRSLRTQSHEHANLVHAVYGLLAIGEVDEARNLIAGADDRYELCASAVGAGIDNTVVAGFLLAEVAIAGNGGVQIEVDPASRLATLPATLTDLDVVTLLGNLIHNAAEAGADLEAERRRIRVLVSDRSGDLIVNVRDWGPGIPEDAVPDLFRSGHSTKSAHVGVGLALVRSIVHQARGTVTVDPDCGPGACFHVHIPAA